MIKLIKYDLKSILPDIAGFYLAFIVLAGLFPVFMELSSINVIIVLYFLAGFGTLIAIGVLTYVAIFNLFYKRLFSHQGYLTLSLPVSTRKLLWSKIISSVLLLMISTLVILISLSLSLLSSALIFGFDWNSLMVYVNYAQEMGLIEFLGKLTLALTPYSIASTLYSLTLVLLTITFVHTVYIRKNRILIGVLVFVGFNVVVQRINSYFFSLGEFSDRNFQFRSNMPTNFDFGSIQIPWLNILGYSLFFIILSVALFELARYMIIKKIELE
jgi:hypothetical protein